MSTPDLRTDRLRLDPLTVADADEMVSVLGDPGLYAFTGGEPPDLDGLRATYARLLAGSVDPAEAWHNWIVRLEVAGSVDGDVQAVSTRPAIGTVQATVWVGERRASVAWVIGTLWQGRGYAGEAAGAMVAWLASIGVRTVEASIHPDHAASAAVAARIGLRATDEVIDGERTWRLHAGTATGREA